MLTQNLVSSDEGGGGGEINRGEDSAPRPERVSEMPAWIGLNLLRTFNCTAHSLYRVLTEIPRFLQNATDVKTNPESKGTRKREGNFFSSRVTQTPFPENQRLLTLKSKEFPGNVLELLRDAH